MDAIPDQMRKGRGAIGNVAGRFDTTERFAVDDGWDRVARVMNGTKMVD